MCVKFQLSILNWSQKKISKPPKRIHFFSPIYYYINISIFLSEKYEITDQNARDESNICSDINIMRSLFCLLNKQWNKVKEIIFSFFRKPENERDRETCPSSRAGNHKTFPDFSHAVPETRKRQQWWKKHPTQPLKNKPRIIFEFFQSHPFTYDCVVLSVENRFNPPHHSSIIKNLSL